ncbi:MAG TPA: hydrogenase expression/formation protein HypE [Streptosporangiaceae bacterium]|jgi:hydrogenase expression/formation protein HypE|nr:hydrogenase expression/formation protein HypE [Streptosporangiaceae bacterium]
MTTGQSSQAGWVEEALRTHEEQARQEEARQEEARQEEAGSLRRGSPQPLPGTVREDLVLERIDRARRSRPRIKEERITMSHGAGGKATQTLIEAMFLDGFRNPLLEPLEDAARLRVGGAHLALTTDSYVVSPLFFPGGNIGDLAVNGTVNDLATSGAVPLYLSAGFILEEGFEVTQLGRIVAAMREAADVAGVQIVTGDTKVVERGKADGCYINTAGVGAIEHDLDLGVATARPGDAIIVSGPIGDHGVTIMLARGELDIEADVSSDTAPLNGLVADLLAATPGVRALRDATRGGVATILNEIAKSANVGVLVNENDIPVRAQVRGASELLGIDPMYVACEGRLVAVTARESAGRALQALRAHPLGGEAAIIGHVTADPPGIVQLKTAFGGTRIVDLLVGDPLPRIC